MATLNTVNMNCDIAFDFIEDAVKMICDTQPACVTLNNTDFGIPEGGWDEDNATDAVAAGMAKGDWYWFNGSAYCPACVQCELPAIDEDDPLVQRGGCVSHCTCCGTDYGTDDA